MGTVLHSCALTWAWLMICAAFLILALAAERAAVALAHRISRHWRTRRKAHPDTWRSARLSKRQGYLFALIWMRYEHETAIDPRESR